MTNRSRWRPEGRRDPVGCRWIIGDPRDDDSHFCQRPQRMGSSYCPEHDRKSREPYATAAKRDA